MSTTSAHPSLLVPSPQFDEAVKAARADEGATALLNDFVNGVLRRVDKLIREGLAPLGSNVAGYERISDDKEGRKLGVGRQREDNEGQAAQDGNTIPEAAQFRDNDRGASTRSKKTRPEFERLLAYIITGQVRVVYAYSTSRLTRRPLELELLIRVTEATGVRYVTKASGSDDLTTANGRMIARIKAAVDAAEAETTAERVSRAALDAARKGKPGGGGNRPFGYAADRITVVPFVAALIRQAAHDVLYNSASLRSIANAWQAAGIETIGTELLRKRIERAEAEGEEPPPFEPTAWSPVVIRKMLRNPRYAGWRTYKGTIATGLDGAPVRGIWEPILEQDEHDRLRAVLSTGSTPRQRGRRGSRVYLLSGIVVCGVCKRRMNGARIDKPDGPPLFTYRCNGSSEDRHMISVGGKNLEPLIVGAVIAALDEEQVEGDPVVFEGEERIAELRRMQTELRDAYLGGKMKADRYFDASELVDVELDRLAAEREEFVRLTAGPVPERVSAEEWDDLTVGQQRARVESVVEAVVIKPTDQRGAKLDPDRVDIIWRGRRSA